MDVRDQASPSQTKLCASCSRKLLNLEHAKCMYCGEPIPESLKLDPEQAVAIKAQKHKKWREENATKNQWGQPPLPADRINSNSEWGWGEHFESSGDDGVE